MNLSNNLNQRYGQSYIKEVRSWEGKEHKLARHKCHLHFNLRCLSQNIVPKGVKLNIKQFSTFQERKIICKTHRSILNSQVRQCNKMIDNLKSQINKIKTSIKNKCNYKDFTDISNIICKSKEKVFKITKNCQIKKFTYLQKQPIYRNTPVPDVIRKKWVINLSSKPLSDGEQSLLQKGPKFAVSSSKVPLTEYIAVTKRICDELSENTVGRDCTEIYQKTKEVLQHFKEKKGPTCNTTKEEWGGHQNSQRRPLLCGSNSGQGSSPGSHG